MQEKNGMKSSKGSEDKNCEQDGITRCLPSNQARPAKRALYRSRCTALMKSLRGRLRSDATTFEAYAARVYVVSRGVVPTMKCRCIVGEGARATTFGQF